MKKFLIVFVVAASSLTFIKANEVNSQTLGYEMIYEKCEGTGYQQWCRWNDASSCIVSDQTSCGGGGGPIE
jgi:hypothetical protein